MQEKTRAFDSLSDYAININLRRHSSKPYLANRRITLNNFAQSMLKKPARDHGFLVRHTACLLVLLFRLSIGWGAR